MPKTEREVRREKAYQNIKKITGLQFDETNLEEVNHVLNTIYIDGKNLFAERGWKNLDQSSMQRVEEISRLLTKAMDVSNTSFISIMKRDDSNVTPITVPYTEALDETGKKIKKVTPEIREQMKKKQAAIAEYESHFQNTMEGSHGARLAELRRDIAANVTGREKYQKVQDFFDGDFVTTEGEVKGLDGNSFAMSTKAADLVNVCNLVLLGRGFSEVDFEKNTEELQDARKKAGEEIKQLMTDNLDKEARTAAFRELMEDAMEGMDTLRFKPLDLSDDSTFDNYKYNQWAADMVKSLYSAAMTGMMDLTREPDIVEKVKDLREISQSLDGINKLDRIRLVPEYGTEGLLRSNMAQVVVDRLGADYGRYHMTKASYLAGAKDISGIIASFTEDMYRDSDDLEAMQESIDEERQKLAQEEAKLKEEEKPVLEKEQSEELREARKALAQAEDELSVDNLDEIYTKRAEVRELEEEAAKARAAYEAEKEIRYTKPQEALAKRQASHDESAALLRALQERNNQDGIRKVLDQHLTSNPELLGGLAPQMKTISDGNVMKEGGVAFFHYPEGQGRSLAGYRKRMAAVYDAGGQMDRISTIASLTLGYACLKEKQQAQKLKNDYIKPDDPFSLVDYIENTEMQESIVEEAFAYFEAHPIRINSTDEAVIAANRENIKKIGEMVAALQDKILDTQLPKMNHEDPAEVAKMQKLINSLGAICQDSHQLLDVAKGYDEDFYAGAGGKEAFENKWKKTQAAQTLIFAEKGLQNPKRLEKMSSQALRTSDALFQQCISINFISHHAEGLSDKKIGEIAITEDQAQDLEIWSKFIKGTAQQAFKKLLETEQGLQQALEYVRSFGKNDPANIKKLFDDTYLMSKYPEAYMAQLAREQEQAAQKQAEEQAAQLAREQEQAQNPAEQQEEVQEEEKEQIPAEEQAQEQPAEAAPAEEQAEQPAEEVPAPENEVLEEALYGEEENELDAENMDDAPEENYEVPGQDEAADQLYEERLNSMAAERKELLEEDAHDWFKELGTEEEWGAENGPAEKWKKRIDELKDIMNEAETSWMTNGREEFRDIQSGLDEATRLLAGDIDIPKFGRIMDNILKRADDYIERKDREGVKGITGERRLEAVKNLKGKLVTGNTDALEPEMISAMFGHDVTGRELTQQEMFERCMSRIAVYLETADSMEDPAKQQEMYDNLEKVLIQRGKNSEARNKLVADIADGDNVIRSEALANAQRISRAYQKNLGAQMEEDTARIRQEKIISAGEKLRKLAAQKCIESGISEKTVVWSKLLNAYDTLAAKSENEAIRDSVNHKKEVSKLNDKTIIKYGETCAKALEASYNRNTKASYTEQEAVAIVSAAAYTDLMKIENGRNALNGAMKHYDDKKLESFVKKVWTGSFNMVEKIQTETDPKKRAEFTKAKNLEILGAAGAREVSLRLISEEAHRLGEANRQSRMTKKNNEELKVGEEQQRKSMPQAEGQRISKPQDDVPQRMSQPQPGGR